MSSKYKLVNAVFDGYDNTFTTITVADEYKNLSKEEFIEKFPEAWKEMKLKAFDIIVEELKVLCSEDINMLYDLVTDVVSSTGKWEYSDRPEAQSHRVTES